MARQGEYDFTVIGAYNNPEEEEDQAIDFTLVEEAPAEVKAEDEESAIDFTLVEEQPEQLPEPKTIQAGQLGEVTVGPFKSIAKRSWQDEVERLEQLKAQGETVDPIHNKPIDERINFAKMTARNESLANARRAGATEEDIKRWQDRYSWFERYMEQPGKKAWHKLLMAGEARDLSTNLENLYDFDKVRTYLEEAKALPEESLLGSTRADRTQLAYRIWNNKIVPEIQNCKECMQIWESQNKGVGLTGQRNAPDFTPEFVSSVENYFTGMAQKRLLEVVKEKIELGKIPEDPVSRRMVEQLDSGEYGNAFQTFLDSPFGLIWNTSVESLGVSVPALIEGAYGGAVAGPWGVALGVANGSFQVDYALEIMGRFEAAGIDFNAPPEEVLAQMRTPGVYEEVVSGARNHAAAVAFFDAVTGGLATKVIAPKAITSPAGRVGFSTLVVQPQIQGFGGALGETFGQLYADGQLTSVGEIALEYLGEFGTAPVEVATLRASIRDAKSQAEIQQNASAVLEKVNAAFGTNFTNIEDAYHEIRLRRSVDGYNDKLPEGQGVVDITSLEDGKYRVTIVDKNGEQKIAVGTAQELSEIFPTPTEEVKSDRVVNLEPILVTPSENEAENVYAIGVNENGDDILFKGTIQEAEDMRSSMETAIAEKIDIERRRLESTQEPSQVVMPTEEGEFAVYDPSTGDLVGVYQDETAASIVGESLADQAALDAEVDQVAAAEEAIAQETAALDAEEAPMPAQAVLPPEVMENLSPEAQEAINANESVDAAYQAVLQEAESIQSSIDATEGMPPEFMADLQAQVKAKIEVANEIKNAAVATPAEAAPEQPAVSVAEEAVPVTAPIVEAEIAKEQPAVPAAETVVSEEVPAPVTPPAKPEGMEQSLYDKIIERAENVIADHGGVYSDDAGGMRDTIAKNLGEEAAVVFETHARNLSDANLAAYRARREKAAQPATEAKPEDRSARDIDLGVFRDEGGRFRSPTAKDVVTKGPRQQEPPAGKEIDFTLVGEPTLGPTSTPLPLEKVTVPSAKSQAIFEVAKADLMAKATDIAARPSPDESVARSKNKAEAALRGEYPPRKPLEVWEVTRPDGSKFYSLRDGNTTFQFLTSQGWTEFPVNVTKRIPLSEYTAPSAHKAVTLPGGWNGTKDGLQFKTKLDVIKEANKRNIDRALYDIVELGKGFRAVPKAVSIVQQLPDMPGEHTLPTVVFAEKEETPAFDGLDDISFVRGRDLNRFGKLDERSRQMTASAVQHLASRMPEPWIREIRGFMLAYDNYDSATYYTRTRAISIQASFFDQVEQMGEEAAMQKLETILAHEIWHDVDIEGLGDGGPTSVSASSPLFNIDHVDGKDGEILAEVRKAMRENDGIYEYLKYPFAREYAILNGSKDFGTFKAELFAQLGALYLTRPEMMAENLPKAYKLFQQIEEKTYARPVAERRSALRETLQASDTLVGLNVTGLSVIGEEDQQRAGKEPAGARVEGERPRRDRRLEVIRQERGKKAVAILTKSEIQNIEADAKKYGVPAEPFITAAREYKKAFPARDGWAQISVAGLLKDPKPNNPASGIKWQPIRYNFHLDKETGKPTKATHDARVAALSQKVVSEIEALVARAKKGDKNAKIILKHEGWYKNMIHRLREDFGASADLYADLLGAFSPNTDVKQNWQYAVEAMQQFSRGEFDAEMAELESWMNAGNPPSKFEGKKITRLNGKLFGMNSTNGMIALMDLWRAVRQGTAPKARNFSGNLIGGTTRATIDVWAARFLRRLNGDIRIPPGAEIAVSGNFLAGSEDLKTGKIGGEYGFGAAVFQQASDALKKDGIDLEPMDLQAVVWFLEKEMWATNNWTTMAGEGGSFEEEADANPLNRYVFGFSIQQDTEPTDRQMADARKKIEKVMAADDNIIAYKVIPTYGRYAGWDERSFDIEITTTSEYTPDEIVGLVASLGKQANQKDVFISRVIKDLEEENPNARPAAEIYFRSQADLDAIKPILERMTSRELDGFTFTVDPRKSLQTKKGETPSEFIGVRFQMVPEFTQRAIEQGWTTAEENPEIASLGQSAILDLIARKMDALDDAVAELRSMPEVAYAQAYSVDTLVIGKENYDDYITAKNREANKKAGGTWFGQPLLAGLERSARRLGLPTDGAAVLRGAVAGQEEVAPSISPSVRLSVGQPISKVALSPEQQATVEYKIREVAYNRDFDEVYQIAPEDQKKLAEVAARIQEKLGERGAFLNPGIKRRARAEEKFQDKHYVSAGVMTDIVRGGFALWDPADIPMIIEELSKEFVVYDEGLLIKPDSGYFDQKLLIRFDDGTVAEIQLWETHLLQSKEGKKFTDDVIPDYMKDPWARTDATPELIAQAKARGEWFPPETGGHAIYEQTRTLKIKTDKVKIDELNAIQSELYRSALRAAPNSWAAAVEGRGEPESLISQAEAEAQLTPSSEKKPSSPEMAPSRPSQFQYESTSESLNGLDIVVPPDVSVVTLSQANKVLEDVIGAKTVSDLTRSGDLVIMQSVEDVREHMRRNGSKFVDQVTADMQGLHDPSTDTAYIVVDSLYSPEDIVGVFYHEVGVHYGLQKMLGAKNYTLIANMVRRLGMLGDKAVSAAIRDVIIAERLDIDVVKAGYQNKFMKQATPEQIEEVMGYLVEKNPEVTIAQRIIAAIKRFLLNLGFPAISEADIRATIISAARRREGVLNVTKGKKPLFSKITTSQNFKPGTMFGLSRSGHIAAMAWKDAAGKWTVAFNRDSNGLPLQKGTRYERYDTAEKAERAMQIIGLATQINAPQLVQAIESEKFVDGLSTLSMSTWDWFVTKAQDKFRALENTQRLIERERGAVSEAADAYMREALYHGRAEAMQSKFNEDFIEPMVQLMKKYKLSVAEVDNFLYARHAPEANARLKKINANKPKNEALSGMSNADAAKIIAGFKKKKMQGLQEIAKIFDSMNESRLRLMVDGGLIEADLAATWRATYQYYAPLIGFEEEIETQTPSRGKGFEARGKEKRRFGRRSRAANILTNAIAMYESQIVRAERNRVGQALLNLANENPNTDFWSVNQPSFRREIDKKTGLVKLVGESARMRTNVFVVKVQGKDHWVTFNERNETAMQIAKVMKGLGTEQINLVMGGLLKINRFLSAIYTSYNPEFLVSNFARDLQTAFINLNDTDANAMKLAIIKDVRKAYAAIRRVQKGGIGKSKMKQKWNDYYTEFYQAGAQTGWVDNYKSIQQRAKALEGQLKAAKRGILNPMRLAIGTAELIQNLNLAVENAIRLSTYIHLREAGTSRDKAANVAKNLTVNFNRKGEAGTAMNSFYLFYNAAIQGTARIFVAAARSKKARGVMYGVVAFATILDIINRLRACDDEAGQNMYDKIPFSVKERNLVIMKEDCSGDFYQIPMPYGYNVLGVLGQQMGDAVTNPEFDAVESVMRVARTVFSAFNPIGSEGSFSQIVSPTLLDPIVQVQENKNWFGGELVPERFPGKGGTEIPDSQRYWTSTREPSKAIAEWVNEMTGGDAARPGAIDISPAVIDMLFDTYTGGAGKFIANVSDTLDRLPEWAAGEEIESANIPFVRKVFRTRMRSGSTESFFEYNKDVAYTEEQLDSAKETKDRERYNEIMSNQRPKVQMIKYRKMIEQRIQSLNKKKTAVENSKLPQDQKDERKKELNDLIFMTRMNFIQRYRKIVLGLD